MGKYDDDIDLWAELYKRRRGLGPFYLAAATATTAGCSALLDTPQTVVGLGAVALAGGLLIGTKIRDKLRRIYSYTVLGTSVSWIMTTHEIGVAELGWTTTGLLASTLVLGVPWWTSSRKQIQVRMEDTVRDWPKLARRIGLDHASMPPIVVTPTGYRGKLTWPGGMYDVDSVQKMQSKMEGVLGADRGAVSLELDGKSTNSIKFDVVTQDPHAVAQPWPLPTHLRRGVDPVTTGIRSDGEYRRIQKFTNDKGARHILIGGQSESGKSSLINLLMASDVCSEDVFSIGLDFKRVELGPWRPALGFMTSELREAIDLILSIGAPGGAIDERTKIMEEHGRRVWDTAWGPWISITVDEIRDFVAAIGGAALNAWIRIKTQGRAVGIGATEATQYPTLAAVGSSQSRQQNRYAFCFRMLDSEGEGYVIPGHRVFAEKIPGDRPGTCYMRDAENVDTKAQRILYIDDDTRDAVVNTRAGNVCELDERTESAMVRLFPGFADRDRWYRDSEGDLVRESSGTERESTGTEPVLDRDPERESTGTASGTGSRWDRELDETERYPTGTGTGVERDPAGTDTEPDVDLADIIAARRARLSPEERDSEQRERESILTEATREDPDAPARLRALLTEAGEQGVTPKEAQLAVSRGSSWFYGQMGELLEQGLVKRMKHGRWGWTGEPVKASSGNSE